MTSALKVSILPQSPSGETKKSSKAKSLTSPAPANRGKKSKSPTLSPFAQMLLQQSLSTSPSTQKIAKEDVPSKKNLSSSQRKNQIIQAQKTLLTQNKLKIQTKTASSSSHLKNQLREALMIKSDKKTTQDIRQIAKDHALNLSKLEIVQKNTRSQKRIAQKTPKAKQEIPQNPNIAKTKPHQETLKPQTSFAKNQPIHTPAQTPTIDPNQSPNLNQPANQLMNQPINQGLINQQNMQIAKDSALVDLLANKDSLERIEEKKTEKSQDLPLSEVKKETQFKIAQSRETLSHFSQRLKEEIANYRPPLTRLSMELNPKELGKLEVTITKKGKELQISVNTNNPQALQTFIQNQNEFKSTLTEIGFNSIDLSFSQGDSQKEGEQQEQEREQDQKGNKNSFEHLAEAPSNMEIKMVQYA